MGEVGSIWIKLGARIDDFERNISDAEKAIKKVGKNFEDIGKKVSIAGAAIVGSMGLAIVKTAKFGDELDEMSERTGVSASTLSSLKLAADKSGTSLSGLAQGMKLLSISMTETAKAASKSKTELGQLGINVKDTSGNLRPLNEVMLDVAERFKTMPDGAQKTTLAVKIFGRAGAELIPVLNMGKQGLKEQMDMAQKLGIVMSGKTAKACAEFMDAQENLKASVQGLTMQISMQLIPTLTNVVGFVSNAIAKVKDWAKENPAVADGLRMISGSLLALGGLLAIGGPILIGLGMLLKYLRELKLIAKAPIAIVITVAIPVMAQIIKDFKANMKDWQDAADRAKQKTSGLMRIVESANAVWDKWINGIDRHKIAMQIWAVQSDRFKASAQGMAGVAGEAAIKLDLTTKKTKSWNEELGVTTRLEMEKHIALMEQALAKYADKMPISEQARLKEEIKQSREELAGFNITAQEALGLLPKLRDNTNNFIASLDKWDSALPNLRKKTIDLFVTWEEYSKKPASSMKELASDTLSMGQQISNTIANMIGAIAGTIGQNLSAAKQRFLALVQSMILGAVQICVALGTIKAATGDIIGAIVALGGAIFAALFGGKAKKTTAERLAEELVQMTKGLQTAFPELGKISEAVAKTIAEDMQGGMEGYVAVSKNFASVIQDVGVNQQNVNELWSRAGWIIDEMTSGMLNATDGAKSLGESFKLLVDGAKKLGQEGSLAMVEFIKKIRQSGLEIAEVTEYVLDQLGKIPSALSTIVKNIYMPTTPIKELEKELDKLTEKLKGVKEGTDEWKTITDRISEINKELSLSNRMIPRTARDLEAMGHIATATFHAMLANGKTLLQALDALKEPLHELLVRYKALGIEIPKFLHPLIRMEWLAEKFPAAFQNMSAALDILNSLRNSAYLTQDTFSSLLLVVNQFARAILQTSGNLDKFMHSAKLSQTQIQALLPIITQFVGAAAIFGLGIPSWMKTFVTKQLGVDWGQFRDMAKNMANSGIATVEQLKARIKQAKELNENLKSHAWKTMVDLRKGLNYTLGRIIDAIRGLPGEINSNAPAPTPPMPPVPGMQHGGIVYAPRTVTVGEVPEAVMPLDKLSQLLKTGIHVEIQPVVIPKGDKYIIEFLQKSIERGNIRIPITAVG